MHNDREMVRKECCETWRLAHQNGTDNEGYEALVFYDDGQAKIGDRLPNVAFCPWCGAAKQ